MKRLDGLKAFLQGLRASLRTPLVALVVCLGLIGGSHAFFTGGAPAYGQQESNGGGYNNNRNDVPASSGIGEPVDDLPF